MPKFPTYQPVPDVPGVALVPEPAGPFEAWAHLSQVSVAGDVTSQAARLRYQDGLIDIQLVAGGPDIFRRNAGGQVLVYDGETCLNP